MVIDQSLIDASSALTVSLRYCRVPVAVPSLYRMNTESTIEDILKDVPR